MFLQLGKRVLWAMLCLASLGVLLLASDDQVLTEVFEPGGLVRAPKLIRYVEPEFPPSSKEAFVEGTVKISTVVTMEGLPSRCEVVSGLNRGRPHRDGCPEEVAFQAWDQRREACERACHCRSGVSLTLVDADDAKLCDS